MADNTAKIAAGLASLVGLWILVYWWWEPSEPPISFGTPPSVNGASPEPPADAVPAPPAGDLPQQGPAPQPASVSPPLFRTHTVETGETFGSIARRYFGPGASADLISRANPLVDPTRLRPGRVIRIPVDPGAVQTATDARPPSATAEGGYTVRAGDTLSAIASRVYGDSRLGTLIFEANRDVISDPDRLRVGARLRLPARPSGEEPSR